MTKTEVAKWLANNVSTTEAKCFANNGVVAMGSCDLMALIDTAIERVALKHHPKTLVIRDDDVEVVRDTLATLDRVLSTKRQVKVRKATK